MQEKILEEKRRTGKETQRGKGDKMEEENWKFYNKNINLFNKYGKYK